MRVFPWATSKHVAVAACTFVLVSSLVSWSMFTCGKEGKHVGEWGLGKVRGPRGQGGPDRQVQRWKEDPTLNQEPGVS